MKVTRSHVEFWCQHRAPQFVREALIPNPKNVKLGWAKVLTVLDLIPSGLPDKVKRDCDWHNILVSLKWARNRGGYIPDFGDRIVKSDTPVRDQLAHLCHAYPCAQGQGLERPRHNRKGAIARRLFHRVTEQAWREKNPLAPQAA